MIVRPLAHMNVLSPPLIMTKEQVDTLAETLRESIIATMADLKEEGLWQAQTSYGKKNGTVTVPFFTLYLQHVISALSLLHQDGRRTILAIHTINIIGRNLEFIVAGFQISDDMLRCLRFANDL